MFIVWTALTDDPCFKFGSAVFADVHSFGDFHVESDEKAIVEPDGDVGDTVSCHDELFVCPCEISGVKGGDDLFQCFGVGIFVPVFEVDESVFVCCVKTGYIFYMDG